MPVDVVFAHEPIVVPIDGGDQRFAVRRIYCVGRNYVSHIREMKEGDEKDPPFFFQKPTDSIVLDGGVVPFPPATDNLQFEIELVVAVGQSGRNVSAEEAWGLVYGYAVGIDLTRRDRQFECRDLSRPWEAGKSFDHSAPCGAIRRRDAIGNMDTGAIHICVNGVRKQSSDISLMIWSVPEIIANLSRQYVLRPGDLIFTGTPEGVAKIGPGDVLEGSVTGLPPLRVSIGAAETTEGTLPC